ncbi:MAG: DUF547 domain-containing protein [Myxococcota bacterium]
MVLVGCGHNDAAVAQEHEVTPEPMQAPAEPTNTRGNEAPATAEAPAETPESTPPPAEAEGPLAEWGELLATYVTEDGGFRYQALHDSAEDKAKLVRVSEYIGGADVSGLSRDEALAFYINAYNIKTIHSVIHQWPIRSVMRVRGFFDRQTHPVAGEEITLNHLENEIIRSERFAEPRIHFAVNCASAGCPPLQNRVFTAANLEDLLEDGTRDFVRNSSQASGRNLRVSQLFEWFAGDFEAQGGVKPFLARYLEGEAAELARGNGRVRFIPYDWDLNGRE